MLEDEADTGGTACGEGIAMRMDMSRFRVEGPGVIGSDNDVRDSGVGVGA